MHNLQCGYPLCEQSSIAAADAEDDNLPTMLTINGDTDLTKVHEHLQKPKIKRALVAMEIFQSPFDFENWQRQEPREIFEVTPKAIAIGERVHHRIFVTYNGGVIE